jgi:tRNA-2-methylthio-N6-dimethylallyladenosine synthase
MKVLFDGKGRELGQIIGRSPYMQSVFVKDAPENLIGTIAEVKITEGRPNSLMGELV